MSFSFKTIQPIMVAGSNALHVDARTLFETYGLTGRFRDWVRRTLKPYMEGLGAPLTRYVKDENPHQRNYYFEATYMVPVIEVCIRPRVGEDEAVAETTIPSVAVNTPVSGPTRPVQPNLDFNIQERINTFLGQVDACETRRNIVRSVTDLMAGFNDLLSQTTATPVAPVARQSVEFTLPWHPYSVNYMYERSGIKTRRRRTYNNWCHKADSLIPNAPAWFNPNAPLDIDLHFGHVEGYDVDNLAKSAIDALQRSWGFNDILVQRINLSRQIVPKNLTGAGSDLSNGFIKYTVYQ